MLFMEIFAKPIQFSAFHPKVEIEEDILASNVFITQFNPSFEAKASSALRTNPKATSSQNQGTPRNQKGCVPYNRPENQCRQHEYGKDGDGVGGSGVKKRWLVD
jgi:hypothetical protein